ncbi:hypothetical protein V1508DRAFT_261999 [Lipomyces doorenjongii]|uniref:uncharacterized protein n=1 Tax=Lipomyces doorenjongii TaxID=383834 RepID=UPI0034CDE81F
MCYLFAWSELPCCIIRRQKDRWVKSYVLLIRFLFFFVSQASLIIRSHTQRAMQKFRWSVCASVCIFDSTNYVCYGFYVKLYILVLLQYLLFLLIFLIRTYDGIYAE